MKQSLPSSFDAECSVLGCLLLDNGCYNEVAAILLPSDFFDINNKIIFEAIKELNAKESPFDTITLSEHLANNKAIQSLGGFTYFTNLARMTPGTANISAYIDIVKQKSILRQLLTLTTNIHNQVYTPNINPRGLMMELEKFISDNQAKKDKTPFLQEASEIIQNPSPQEWLIKHWLPKNALAMLYSKPGLGKSFLALDWALHITANKPKWHNNIVTNGCVVYLAGEGNYGLRRRVKAWVQSNKIDNPEEMKLYISSRGCKLDTVEGFNEVVKAINDLKIEPCLIIVDTLHRFLTGHVNDSQDAGTMVYYCDKLKEAFRSTVLLVHHVGHGEAAQDRAIGSTAWPGSLEMSFLLSPKEGIMELSQKKSKDDKKADPILLELTEVVIDGWLDSDNEAVTSAIIIKSNKILEEIEETPAILNAKLLFEAAWRWSGKQLTQDNKPYLLRDHMINYLTQVKKLSEVSARQAVKAGDKDKMMGRLIDANLVKIYSNDVYSGWYICSQNWLNSIV